MAGAVHGSGEADAVINVGVSGPGVMAAALEELPEDADMMQVAERIKQTAFKITRAEMCIRDRHRCVGGTPVGDFPIGIEAALLHQGLATGATPRVLCRGRRRVGRVSRA